VCSSDLASAPAETAARELGETPGPSDASSSRRSPRMAVARELDASLGPGVSPSSRAAVTAGALASQGLLHDARLAVLAALAKDPDEPSLHALLGTLYQKTGLPQQAAESFDEAQFLMTREK